jgi:hypothetical protein
MRVHVGPTRGASFDSRLPTSEPTLVSTLVPSGPGSLCPHAVVFTMLSTVQVEKCEPFDMSAINASWFGTAFRVLLPGDPYFSTLSRRPPTIGCCSQLVAIKAMVYAPPIIVFPLTMSDSKLISRKASRVETIGSTKKATRLCIVLHKWGMHRRTPIRRRNVC